MPMDQHDDGETERDEARSVAGRRVPSDFDCPSCNANNPLEAAPRDGDEVLCNYCGTQYLVKRPDDGRIRLREI